MPDDNIKLFEYAFKELKEDIAELRKELKNIRKDIFGNGSPGMCTKRQDILRKWVEKIIEKEKEMIHNEISRIRKTPESIYNWIWRVCLLLALFGNFFVFMFTFVRPVIFK